MIWQLEIQYRGFIFAAYDKVEMRKSKVRENRKKSKENDSRSGYINPSKSLIWPGMITLTGIDLDWMQSTSMAIEIQQKRGVNPITITCTVEVRDATTAEAAVWPAIKDILEHIGEIMDELKERGFQKITPKPKFELAPGYALLPDELKFVHAMITLLSEGRCNVIIPASNRELEPRKLRPGIGTAKAERDRR